MLVRIPLPHGPGFRAGAHALQAVLLRPRTLLLLAVAAAITFDAATIFHGWAVPAGIGLAVAAVALYVMSRKRGPTSPDDSAER